MFNKTLQWIKRDSFTGVLLLVALAAGLIIENSPYSMIYNDFLNTSIRFSLAHFSLEKPAILWINEGLMAIFFMSLMLEMKREFYIGALQNRRQCILPFAAAIGGIIAPVAIYVLLNYKNGNLLGWPIATTTDIAFVLGIIGILGKSRVPPNLKVFLIAVSIVDDVLAVIIIAAFYTKTLSVVALSLAGGIVLVMIVLRCCRVGSLVPYLLLGLLMWICVVKSGIHATLAGIIVATFIPLHHPKQPERSPLCTLEKTLHPWVIFFILPLFIFANGGVLWQVDNLPLLKMPVSLGIIMGLSIGKVLGVFGTTFLLIKIGVARLPQHCNWRQLLGGSALTGVGFTMSLFFGALAFYGSSYEDLARQAILIGSFIAAAIGVLCLLKKTNPVAIN